MASRKVPVPQPNFTISLDPGLTEEEKSFIRALSLQLVYCLTDAVKHRKYGRFGVECLRNHGKLSKPIVIQAVEVSC